MAREVDPTSRLLPKLSAESALRLITALLVASKTGLPPSLKKSRGRLVKVQAELKGLIGKPSKAPEPGSVTAVQADVVEDASFHALHDFLVGWAGLKRPAAKAHATAASSLLGLFFPDGMGWLNKSHGDEWAIAEARLKAFHTPENEAKLQPLGGALHLAEVEAAHKQYGVTLKITTATADEEDAVARKDGLEHARELLADYVLKAMALRDSQDSKSIKLVNKLIKPLLNWESPAASTADAAEPEPAPAPVVPPATPAT